MKRFAAILLAIVLVFPLAAIASAHAESAANPALTNAIRGYLDSRGYKYMYDSVENMIMYSMSLNSTIGSCAVIINIDNDGYYVLAFPSIAGNPADKNAMRKIAEYLTRANYHMAIGNFEMDFATGEILFKASVHTYDRTPSEKEIAWLVDLAPFMVDEYGDGLAQVILMDADPAVAVGDTDRL